jgi:integrase
MNAILPTAKRGHHLRLRDQRPKVRRCKDDAEVYWYFRYWHDELIGNGLVQTTRRAHRIGPAQGAGALSRKQAESERDRFIEQLSAMRLREAPVVVPTDNPGTTLFGTLAELWEWDYVEATVGGRRLVAASTKDKYRNHLHNHILPRWAATRLCDFRAKGVLDWLQKESGSWYMMTDLRNIMSGIFTKAHEWELLPDTFANPIARVKLPKKWEVYERRILSEQETMRVLARIDDPHRLICEICLATGARISEVTGLQIKHVNPEKGFIRIEQRHWRGNIDAPKTERSKRTLTLGSLAERLQNWIGTLDQNTPEAWLFPQPNPEKPMWDSGVRAALKWAARLEKCDFPGFGLHSLRRANITWRQEVGASSIEASRIAGHASTKMTEQYTIVQLNRQEELTRRIQERLAAAAGQVQKPNVVIVRSEFPSSVQKGLALMPVRSNECAPERSYTMAKKLNGTNRKEKKTKPAIRVREGSKTAEIIELLKRRTGVTLQELMTATGWQAHSVRGFLSAAVGKKMGLQLNSSKREDGQRVYRIA